MHCLLLPLYTTSERVPSKKHCHVLFATLKVSPRPPSRPKGLDISAVALAPLDQGYTTQQIEAHLNQSQHPRCQCFLPAQTPKSPTSGRWRVLQCCWVTLHLTRNPRSIAVDSWALNRGSGKKKEELSIPFGFPREVDIGLPIQTSRAVRFAELPAARSSAPAASGRAATRPEPRAAAPNAKGWKREAAGLARAQAYICPNTKAMPSRK